ncbi:MAG TPA: winged helix-turn-helix domain-containing protein [Dokdonella sp.]|uniref:winged helix-turn-helix domain-containing protein n=1 Tax=Dokdonella sp. TaxID=2291710 RepID=UPI002D8104CC|nr:winged helix-turn-helix domain-containing protein [Dokdonella sp.]HET9033095.1 winged helix-turn-helix domain-containing protein [Dokdonella sp.]
MPDDRRYCLDDLRIDIDRQTVERDGSRLDVGGLSFRLLAALIERGDRVLSFDELIEAVWAPAIVGEETVTQRVKLLRQALGDDGRRPRYIRSVRGQGYQLCTQPRQLEEQPDVAPEDASSDNGRTRGRIVVLGVVVLLIVATGWWQFRPAELSELPSTVPGVAGDELQRARYYARIGQDANNERAISLYETVLAKDPSNVDGALGLSRALSARMCLYNRGTGSAARAEALASNAIAQDAGNSQAHDALGYAYDCRGLIDSALVEYERAYVLDPAARFASKASAAYLYSVKGRLADALKANVEVSGKRSELRFLDIQIARNLELLGFVSAAEQRFERSFGLYPDNVYSNVAWPRSLFLQGRLAEAEAAVALALKRPAHPELHVLDGELALLRGDRQRAREAFARAHAMRPYTSWPDTLLHLHAEAPIDSAWIANQIGAVSKAIKDGEVAPEMYIELALLELGGGHHAAALDALDAAIDVGFRDRAYLQVSPFFQGLTSEPRLAAAIDRIGQLVAGERAAVLAADWLPADLLSTAKATP